MGRELKEGDVVSVPCRHCSELSIPLFIKPGTFIHRCPQCGNQTRFQISEGNWMVRSEGLHNGSPLAKTNG